MPSRLTIRRIALMLCFPVLLSSCFTPRHLYTGKKGYGPVTMGVLTHLDKGKTYNIITKSGSMDLKVETIQFERVEADKINYKIYGSAWIRSEKGVLESIPNYEQSLDSLLQISDQIALRKFDPLLTTIVVLPIGLFVGFYIAVKIEDPQCLPVCPP